MSPDELYDTCLNPENRKLIQLTTENMKKTLKLYDELMGKSALLRRNFIIKHKLQSIEFEDLFEDVEAD